jgi:hypothetical protein
VNSLVDCNLIFPKNPMKIAQENHFTAKRLGISLTQGLVNSFADCNLILPQN